MKSSIEFKTAAANPQYEGVRDVEPQELQKMRNLVKIIDVRQPEEFTGELGHIPEAELVVLNTIPEHMTSVAKDENLVLVCRSGARSGQATAFLMQNGFKNVFNLKGGMILWNQLNLPKE